jgi:hypothetical protein
VLTAVSRAPKSQPFIVTVVIAQHKAVSSIEKDHLGSASGCAAKQGFHGLPQSAAIVRYQQRTPTPYQESLLAGD